METMEEFVRNVYDSFSNKSPKEIGKDLARRPENIYKFIGMIYIEKQSVQRQDDICWHVFYNIVHDFENDRDCFGGI